MGDVGRHGTHPATVHIARARSGLRRNAQFFPELRVRPAQAFSPAVRLWLARLRAATVLSNCTEPGMCCVGRLLKSAFSIFLILAGGYFLFLFLKHPTPYGALHSGAPSIFWIGLGAFLIWYDKTGPGKAPPA
jgi:hypothetical protein